MTKPIVRYVELVEEPEIGGQAVLVPADHPRSELNWKDVWTSRVESYDQDTGRIETLNTIYLPE